METGIILSTYELDMGSQLTIGLMWKEDVLQIMGVLDK